MRIAYAIHGYGRGHATRALAVLPELRKRHEILILAGGDAYDLLRPEYPAHRIPTLRYYYGRNAQRSSLRTVFGNLPSVIDLTFRGPAFESVAETIRDFGADVVISDAEGWSHRAAKHLGIPRIGFDHFGVLVHCALPTEGLDVVKAWFHSLSYRWLMGIPERVIVSSFYPAPPRRPGVAVVGPLLRPEVTATAPREGEHLLAYFNKGVHQFTPAVEAAFRALDMPVRVYGAGQRKPVGKLQFLPTSNLPFVEDLASCRAVVSTAGNQLVGEAIHFGKPMLVIPEATVEQRINAAALERLGLGMRVDQHAFGVGPLLTFLSREREFRANIATTVRDGWSRAVDMIERYIAELTGNGAPHAVDTKANAADGASGFGGSGGSVGVVGADPGAAARSDTRSDARPTQSV